jgi:3-methyladenine DNA glycosylase/8-oxoguanine DNA glycosylase
MVEVRGIGRWTAEWVLMRALGRLDILPAGDLALRRVVSELYFDATPINEAQLAAFGKERWSPYRGLATTYLFAYLRQQRLEAGAGPAPEPA